MIKQTYTAEPADAACIPSWLALVNLVSGSFPGLVMEEYTEVLQKNIARGTALCVKDSGRIIGILLYAPRRRILSCMAVHPEYRRTGVASVLIAEMLRRMPEGDVSVTTFRAEDEKGNGPRALYQKFGFRADVCTEEFGYPVQRFVLSRREKTAESVSF